MSSENEEIIRRAYQRAEDKDIEGWVNSFTPDGTFTDQSIGVVYSGPDELGQTVENYALAFPQRRLEVTTVYVSHDQVEAMTMGDRVAVMRAGQLQQLASPTELYDQPANIFVASFIGSPAMNRFEATAERGGIRVGNALLQPPTPNSTRPRGMAS